MWWLLLRFLPRPGMATYGAVLMLLLLQFAGVDVFGMALDLLGSVWSEFAAWLEEVIADSVSPW